jgi:hypothetical protein
LHASIDALALAAAFVSFVCFSQPAGAAPAVAQPAGFTVSPAQVTLDGNFAQTQLLVTAIAPAGVTGDAADPARLDDLTTEARFISADEKIVTVNAAGRLFAVADGRTKVRIELPKSKAAAQEIDVEVRGVLTEAAISYSRDVAPLLSKHGCNAASCHASQHGKGGFKLSVFGYAPDEDFLAIARDRQARRVNLNSPAESLVLLKPTLAVPHGGGRKLPPGSIDYKILLGWLSAGAPQPKSTDPYVTGLRVEPQRRITVEGRQQQLRVTATYSDGRQRDVTAWAKFDSMDEATVRVTPQGLTRTEGRGQAVVMVRFEGQAELSTFVVPYSDRADLAGWKNNNFIDELASAKFKELGISPSPLCDDSTFLRRAFLDATGTVPTLEETRAFLSSKDPQKRTKLIDQLLGLTGDPKLDTHNNEYAAYWSLKWADLIRNSSETLGEQGMWAMHNWLKDSFRENKPMDQFVRELITAQGSIYRNGPANYYRVAANPQDLAETTSQLFLGVRLTCAKCHHHPFEKYSQDDYYGFAAYFARVSNKTSMEFGLFGREQVIVVKTSGDVRHPKSNKVLQPTPLDGQPNKDSPAFEAADRRVALAEWLTSAENPYFARNIVNRYMAYLLGAGLVEPVDDLRATNPASNIALWTALSKDFAAHKFDVKHLLRTIMSSRLYQLSSQPTQGNVADSRYYTHYPVKRLAAEPLLDAIDYVTGVPTKFKNMPLGTRAIELPDSNYTDYFLTTFGKPRRVSVCECERVADENLSQALHTLNGDTLSIKLSSSSGRIAGLVKQKAVRKPDEIITELYLVTLARQPNAQELQTCLKLLDQTPDLQVFCEDLVWSLLNSKQFLFVH